LREPSIGETVTVERLSRDPYRILARLRAESPVAWVPELSCWLVTGYDAAVEVMRDAGSFTVDHPGFSTQQVIGPSMLSLDGAAHRLHRDPFSAPFRLQAIGESVSPWIEGKVTQLISAVEPDGSADLRQTLARPLAVETMAHVLGLDGIEATELVGWYEAIVGAVDSVTVGEGDTAAGRAAFAELSVAVRSSSTTSPLLAAVSNDGDLTLDELASNVAVLLFGGIVTGDGTNSMVIQHLLATDGLLTRARDEPRLVPAVVDESLRLEPAAAAVDRFATRDFEMYGASIHEGDLVRVSLTAANRDPAVFPSPDVLDIHRENRARHLTFARGPHACLGVHLARAEAMAIVTGLTRGLHDPRLILEQMAAPEGLVFRGLERVPVRWSPREIAK